MIDKIIKLGYTKLDAIELMKVSNNIERDYKRLLDGYSIQYLIGYVNFCGFNINVNKNVLIPRFETEFLVEKVIEYYKLYYNRKVNILDIGTGSGCIAISLKKMINSNVDAVDISKDALNVAQANAKYNNADINFIKSDLLNEVNGKYDIVVSNPPYIDYNEKIMDLVFNNEPHIALFAPNNGLYFYEKILSKIKPYLNDKFIIAFEIGYLQAEAIKNIINKYFYDVEIIILKDLSNRDRYAFIISE